MLATQRYYYLALAAFLVFISFSFFVSHGESIAHSELMKSPYRYACQDLVKPRSNHKQVELHCYHL